ncbi:hypothetical protein OEZ86_000066 [Tetradesmus obliquus]|nr:hypothetical protein OEZ86_000066 [Tetradesmus obliquus]
MQDNDQQGFLGAPSTDLAARTAGGKPKTREVKARYLQAKPTPASHRQLPPGGRPSQAFQSAPAGWVELQLPNHHGSTPLMVNTAAAGSSASAVFTQTGKPRRTTAQPTPATGATQQRALLQQRRQQQQQQQQQQQAITAGLVTPASTQQAAGQQRQQQQHDVAPMPDTGRNASTAGPPQQLHSTSVSGALISPGSSRSSTSCSVRHGHDVGTIADNSASHARHPGSVAAAELQTPQASRLSASMGLGCPSAVQLGRMGMSLDIGSAMRGSSRRPSDKEAAELKAKLEAYKASKQQHSARGAPVSARGSSQGGFKEPAPKTMFKAAAASMAGLVKAPNSAPGRHRLKRDTQQGAAAAAGIAARMGQEGTEGVRQQMQLQCLQRMQLRHLIARMEAALHAKKDKANTAIAAAAAAVVDLYSELQAVKGHLQHEQWRNELQQVLQRQLPKLKAWADLQAQHSSNLGQLQAACRTALSHVPLLNGASVGHAPEAPDLDLLQRQLVHGMQLLQEVQLEQMKQAAAAQGGI